MRFIVWSFLKARLQFTLDQFNGATSAVTKDLGLSEEVVNVEGGAIAHGHPIGATGAVLTTRLLHSMQRDGSMRLLSTLKSCAIALAALAMTASVQAADITSAGSTFVFPILSKWSAYYSAKTEIHVNYQSIGSGGGLAQIKAGTVDFGAADAPMKPEELQNPGMGQFPLVIGGIVPVVNIEGVQEGQIRFTGPLLADIYLGKIKNWNDPAIAKINPDLKLPAAAISVVHRSDGSGNLQL
ncbi:MAG TPA: extracellular solute-binding protein, partial [Xanthobacteraceae bacterium]|nr:extracellular solute-binding protein [Xanthobacteraceae bacterium]